MKPMQMYNSVADFSLFGVHVMVETRVDYDTWTHLSSDIFTQLYDTGLD